MKPEDELIDALLKEQARKREADEALLSAIEDALDEDAQPKRKPSAWRRALPLSIAAALAMTAAIYYQQHRNFAPEMAIHEEARAERTTTGVAPDEALAPRALRELEANPATQAPVNAEPNRDTDPAAVLDTAPAAPAELAEAVAPPPAATELMAAPAAEVASNEGDSFEDERRVRHPRVVVPPAGRRAKDTAAAESLGANSNGRPPETSTGARPLPLDDSLAMKQAQSAPRQFRTDRIAGADAAAHLGNAESIMGRAFIPAEQAHPDNGGGGDTLGTLSRENYGRLIDQPWKSPWDDPLSTFSIDVDTASYTNLRRMIREGRVIQPDAVRLEECINYFDYRYPAPGGDSPFAVHSLLATCPWQPENLLARVAIKGREIESNARPASNLVFLIDVSGSMQSPDKLPLLKRSMQVLIDSLDERDRVGIVVYAGTEGVVLEPTLLDQAGKSAATQAIAKLESGGSTNGGAGLARAYRMALAHKVNDGVNRVILATDGDFNVGTTGQGQLVDLVKGNAAEGVSLSVLGFGTGNLNDAMLEAITNDGNGNYFYVDGDSEAKRVFLDKLTGTLVTIAKDVKIQVEFNPGKVKAYRLIGYANRALRNQDFNNDKVDAGDIGAGHTVTAFYEIVPVGVAGPATGEVDGLRYQQPEKRGMLVESDDWFTLKLRYKHPEGEKSRLIEAQVKGEAAKWEDVGLDFRFASAVALFGMKLRNLPEVADIGWDRVEEIARPALADDPTEQRAEFLEGVRRLRGEARPGRPAMLEAPSAR